ncbi:MAG: MFS transporter [Christensenellaceae bacterium]|jgi:Na+/melibiose symporter-like transporter|nr:MFS transporter [Christensenellaceae bacterium]
MKSNANSTVDQPSLSNNTQVNTIPKIVPKREVVSFGIAACGQGMIYAVMSSYISDFYINVLRTPLIFVLLLMLLARVWDAINDPLMGIIIDKATPKSGKMRPYIIISAIPIAILSFLMFYDFGLSATGTMILASFVYVLWGMIYTVADVPFWSMPNIMTPNPGERANVISFGRTLNGVGTALPILIFMILGFVIPAVKPDLIGIESSKLKYIIIASVCSVIGIILFMFSYFGVKERVKSPVIKIKSTEKSNTLKRIFQCKPLMIVIIMGVLSSGRYLMQAGAVHVARYAFYIGPAVSTLTTEAAKTAAVEASISTVSTIFTVCSAIGMFGSMLVMPFLYKKFNYKQIIVFTGIGGFVAGILTLIMGLLNINYGFSWATFVCIPFIIIQCIPLGALNVTAYAMIGDSLDYMEWKTGFRDTALGSACQGFVNKLGNAVATCLIVVVYIFIQIDPAQMYSKEAVVFATDLALNQRIAMFSLVSIVPGISIILCIIPVLFYDLVGKKKDQITKELAERRLAN